MNFSKSFKAIGLCALAVAASSLTSCKGDDPVIGYRQDVTSHLSSLVYEQGVWIEADSNTDFILGDFKFSHSLSEWNTIEGFTPASLNDNRRQDPLFEHQFNIMPEHKAGDAPYIVAFWSSREGESLSDRSLSITRTNNKTFRPRSMKVSNTCYAYYTMTDGDAFTRKFTKGDWFEIIAHGVKADGTETTTRFRLADVKNDTPAEGEIITGWREFNLSPLGEVTGIYFTMASSDNSEWGMNTPAYFTLCDFNASVDDHTAESRIY